MAVPPEDRALRGRNLSAGGGIYGCGCGVGLFAKVDSPTPNRFPHKAINPVGLFRGAKHVTAIVLEYHNWE
jgi:hypothetical protein